MAMLRGMFISVAAMGFTLAGSSLSWAGPEQFTKSPIFKDFGENAPIETDMVIPRRAKFKVAFDAAKAAEPGKANRTLNSAARFINMHAAAGVPEKNMKLAVIVHGPAAFDLLNAQTYAAKHEGAENGSAALIKALTEQGVRVILCGQTAAYRDISKADLLPGVEMALSAMTAHALLQQNGYTVNPF